MTCTSSPAFVSDDDGTLANHYSEKDLSDSTCCVNNNDEVEWQSGRVTLACLTSPRHPCFVVDLGNVGFVQFDILLSLPGPTSALFYRICTKIR